MAQPSPALATPDGQASFGIGSPSGVEVLGQVFNHALARVAVGPQECMIIADTVQTLADRLLRETLPTVTGRENLDSPFFALDLSLYFAPRATFGVNLSCRDRH